MRLQAIIILCACVIGIGPVSARDLGLSRAEAVLERLEAHGRACTETPERMIADCTRARQAPGQLDRLREDLDAMRKALEVERVGWEKIAETYLQNVQRTQDDADLLADAQLAQDAFQTLYKALGAVAEIVRLAHAMNMTSQNVGDWTLNEGNTEKWERFVEVGLSLATLGDEAKDLVELRLGPGSPVDDIVDWGVAADTASLLNNVVEYLKELNQGDRSVFDIKDLRDVAALRPAERLVILSFVQKVGDFLVKIDRAGRSAERTRLERALQADHAQLSDALRHMREANDALLRISVIQARIGPARAAAETCVQTLCGRGTAAPVSPSSAAPGLKGATDSLRDRLDALVSMTETVRPARSPDSAGLCSGDRWRDIEDAEARRSAEALDLRDEIRGLSDEQDTWRRLIAAIRSAEGNVALSDVNLRRIIAAETRIAELQVRIDTRSAEVARLEKLSATAHTAWNGQWQTNLGPVEITTADGTATVQPFNHAFNRLGGRYIVTNAGVATLSGEWTAPPIDQNGAFHWCLNGDGRSFQAWHRENGRNDGRWTRVVDGSLLDP